MKKIYYILFIVLSISFSSCTIENHLDENYNDETVYVLSDFLVSYDLWYVDINKTTGTGNIDFMSKAFTMSFFPDGEVYANNNIVGLGITGNGFGISIGTYDVYNSNGVVSIYDDLAGRFDFEVRQLSVNEITLYNRSRNVTYYLVGYQKYNFDYDRLFYENITYFLQEYEVWTKSYENIVDNSAPFIAENHLRFYVDGQENVFESSETSPVASIANIYWDYSGVYQVENTSVEDVKQLILYYDINGSTEEFVLTILNDQTIELRNLHTDNIYRFTGRDYIQFKPSSRLPIKSIDLSNTHFTMDRL